LYNFIFFFPGVRNSCFSPFIILLSVMFPPSFFLVFFYKVLRREQIFKKGEQRECFSKQKYKYYTRMLPSSFKHPLLSRRKDTDKQQHVYAKPCVQYMPKHELQRFAWLTLQTVLRL